VLLSRPWTLLDIDDAEKFVGVVVRRSGFTLSYHDEEDLTAYLLETVWSLSERYDGSQGSRFSAWARFTLQRRTIDWYRARFGRTVFKFADRVNKQPARPRPLSLDIINPDHDQLGDALTAGAGDRTPDWDSDLGGLFADRDRARVQDFTLLGLEPRGRAA
jgi:hypothetical protein